MARSTTIEISNDLLRMLHRLHRNRTELNERIDRCPRQIKAGEAIVSKAQADVDLATERLKAAKVSCDDKQLQLKSREDQIEQYKAKLNAAASNKEFSLLKERIAADEQANSVQSDEILEGLEVIDELEAKLVEVTKVLKDAQAEHATRVTEVEAKAAKLSEDLQRVESQLAAQEAELPGVTKADYQRLTTAKGEDALAPVEDESCGGCYQTLTAQVVNQVLLSKLTHCPNCNAILYRPEELRMGG